MSRARPVCKYDSDGEGSRGSKQANDEKRTADDTSRHRQQTTTTSRSPPPLASLGAPAATSPDSTSYVGLLPNTTPRALQSGGHSGPVSYHPIGSGASGTIFHSSQSTSLTDPAGGHLSYGELASSAPATATALLPHAISSSTSPQPSRKTTSSTPCLRITDLLDINQRQEPIEEDRRWLLVECPTAPATPSISSQDPLQQVGSGHGGTALSQIYPHEAESACGQPTKRPRAISGEQSAKKQQRIIPKPTGPGWSSDSVDGTSSRNTLTVPRARNSRVLPDTMSPTLGTALRTYQPPAQKQHQVTPGSQQPDFQAPQQQQSDPSPIFRIDHACVVS